MYQRYPQVICTRVRHQIKSRTYSKGPETVRDLDLINIEIPATDTPIHLGHNQQLISDIEIGPISRVEMTRQGYIVFNPHNEGYFIPKAWMTLGLANCAIGKTLVIVRDTTISKNIQVLDLEDWSKILDMQAQVKVIGDFATFEGWEEGATYEIVASLPNYRCEHLRFKFLKTLYVDIDDQLKNYSLLKVLKSSMQDLGIYNENVNFEALRSKLASEFNLADFQLKIIASAKKIANSYITEAVICDIPNTVLRKLSGPQTWIPISQLPKMNVIPTGALSLRHNGQTLIGSLEVEDYQFEEYSIKEHDYMLSLEDDAKFESTLSFAKYVELLRSIQERALKSMEQTLSEDRTSGSINTILAFHLQDVSRFLLKLDTEYFNFFETHKDTPYADMTTRLALADFPVVLKNWGLGSCSLSEIYNLLAALLPEWEVSIVETNNLHFLN